MAFNFSKRSLKNLEGVRPELVKVVRRALEISQVDFTVIEGVRTINEQRDLVKSGASRTMRSRHLTGHAVDLAPYLNGRIRWDWSLFYPIAIAMKKAAKELNVKIRWGGDWKRFKDGPHFQLQWKHYPR